jgi:hypothetical protein
MAFFKQEVVEQMSSFVIRIAETPASNKEGVPRMRILGNGLFSKKGGEL